MNAITRELGQKALQDYLERKLSEWDQRTKRQSERDQVRIESGTFAAQVYERGTNDT